MWNITRSVSPGEEAPADDKTLKVKGSTKAQREKVHSKANGKLKERRQGEKEFHNTFTPLQGLGTPPKGESGRIGQLDGVLPFDPPGPTRKSKAQWCCCCSGNPRWFRYLAPSVIPGYYLWLPSLRFEHVPDSSPPPRGCFTRPGALSLCQIGYSGGQRRPIDQEERGKKCADLPRCHSLAGSPNRASFQRLLVLYDLCPTTTASNARHRPSVSQSPPKA
ncbi:hypothetical protein NHX12_005118 [Muraenolepis orangiensis]|uniref:Uncharacterized protein n=1 Tax=Muraenolepis orangiensis TaxID=630683 RepID=A0A9Q0IBR1_9TELE|nr:hypothetical protein NHX12_005118 [Muraenolepis orangiensis]